jgi:hypothetical protein
MFTSTIEWLEDTRTIQKESVSDLLFWLTNLYDATGQAPDVFDANGNLVAIRYDAKGNAFLA